MATDHPRLMVVIAGLLLASVFMVGLPAASGAAEPPRDVSPFLPGGSAPARGSEAAAVAPSITLVLDAVPDSSQDFAFQGCGIGGCGAVFKLDDDADPALANTVSVGGVPTGTHTITQTAVPNWSTSIFCDTGESVDVANRRVTIDLTAGENVTCWFTNRTQSITVVERSLRGSPQDFMYTGCLGTACGVPFGLDDDEQNDPTLPLSATAPGIPPGTYTITQALVANWALSISCNTNEVIDVANGRVTITLTNAENVTCTFTNRAPAIQISENAVPDDPQAFGFTGCSSGGCGPFSLDDGPGPLSREVVATGLATGTVTITQDAVPGWDLVSVSCGGYPVHATTDPVHRRATLSLQATDSAVCTFTNQRTPGPLTGVAQVSAGGSSSGGGHACARLGDGQVNCWGSNSYGPVGDGSTTTRARPVVVSNPAGTGPLTDIAEVSASGEHTCARSTDGHAYCWGANSSGQLGDGSTTAHARPVVVLDPAGTGPLTDVAEISAGGSINRSEHTCARLTDGHAYCWGEGASGRLGNGTTADHSLPVAVSTPDGAALLADVVEIRAGATHTCARLTSGRVDCWGRNSSGELGDDTTTDRTRPVPVLNPAGAAPITGVAGITLGEGHTCARLVDARAYCWGADTYGELGDGNTTASRPLPVPVLNPTGTAPITGVAEIRAGWDHTCAVSSDDRAYCWGSNNASSRLGDGSTAARTLPGPVSAPGGSGPLDGVAGIATGRALSCALLGDGQVRCWGTSLRGDAKAYLTDLFPVVVAEPAP